MIMEQSVGFDDGAGVGDPWAPLATAAASIKHVAKRIPPIVFSKF